MSFNQSRGEKNEPQQYRRSGRSVNPTFQRSFSGGGGAKGGGVGGSSTAPPSSSSSRSFKATNNAQGVQPRVSSSNTNVNLDYSSSSSGRVTTQNGAHLQPPLRGAPDAPVNGATTRPSDALNQKSTSGPPKATQGNSVTPIADATGPATPTKGSADASRAFPLQFGSISPGVMNVMQIPARTNSAPPNMDEQKQAQARFDTSKAATLSALAVPKQQPPRKDGGAVERSGANETHLVPKSRKNVPASAGPQTIQTQKPSGHPVSGVPMQQVPFHQSQLHLQFGGSNPQLQSQGMGNASVPMPLPMPLPMGNPAQLQQQVFVPGIQHHPMQPQGIIHQGQGMNFSSQMGPPQIGNMGIGLGSQYPQQQTGKYGSRKTVKVTHPDTHEELRLDKRADGHADGGSSGPRSHPHGPPQAQAIPPFPHALPMNYYSSSFNSSPLYFPPANSKAQMTPVSQAPRFYNQVTVRPAASAHGEKTGGSPTNSKSESAKVPMAHGESNSIHSQRDTETITLSSLQQSKSTPTSMANKPSAATFGSLQSDNLTPNTFAASAPVEDSVSLANSGAEVAKRVTVNQSGSFKEEQKKANKKVQSFPQDQLPGHHISSDDIIPETKDGVIESSKIVPSTVNVPCSSALKSGEICVDTKSDSFHKVEGPMTNPIGSKEQGENVSSEASKQHEVTTSMKALHQNEDNNSLISPKTSASMERAFPETSKSKGSTAKGKKKRKEILKNADAQGTTSDLYMAYKGPEEKKENHLAEMSESSPKPMSVVASNEKRGHKKFEPDDWEDAADVSAPKLETGNDGMTKRYSRDFLLKFSEQFTDLPEGFELASDIPEALIVSNRESYPNHGRSVDRSRPDRLQGPVGLGRDTRVDFRSGQGGNYGVLRNPRGQPPGGILLGPMQSSGAQMQRNSSDSDRWQRATGYHKGLIPSPQTLMPVMHKAERKYEVGKVTDVEQAKQRQLKGILNKLTPQNFEKLFEQVKQVNIDNAGTLSGVIAQIFDKALMEPTFCEMYAIFCSQLSVELPDFSEENEKITFKRLLLNKCQEEFERGEREQEEANRTEEEGEVKQSEEEREEKRVKARRRMLGNIRLIGELYKKKMLTERIMHECIKKLLGNYQNPDEEDIEALCKLMSTIGKMIDHPKAKEHMDVYFDMMFKLSNNTKLSSRVRFMLKDAIDLRKNKWQQRRKVEGPKKIDEVHRDAAQERQAQSSRLGRGPNLNSSLRRGQATDFGPRGGNVLPSPNAQMGGFRGLRFEERQSFENRTLSVPLRPIGDESITLGPQGGLARGMSIRGQPVLNGYGSISERTVFNPREDFVSRHPPAYDQSNLQDRGMRNASQPARVDAPMPPNVSSDKVFPEERLHDMSMETIKEFYSAKDEKEVALCIKDLNAPSFYPSMISIWVTDSFERKDVERDSLAKLLVNLSRPQGMLSQDSLVEGFECVLSTLEDAVNDAPRAAEFLGRIFARVLLEGVIPFKEAWRLLYNGGEEQGRLVEVGLAAEVLGAVLEIIVSEKGQPFLNEICAGSNLHIEKFRPPNTKKALRLDKFI